MGSVVGLHMGISEQSSQCGNPSCSHPQKGTPDVAHPLYESFERESCKSTDPLPPLGSNESRAATSSRSWEGVGPV